MNEQEKQSQNNNEQDVDEYTARMDRMVSNLKDISQKERQKNIKMMLIWTIVGILFIVVSMYIMFNSSSVSFDGTKNLF